MVSVWRRYPQPDEIGIELEMVDDEVVANVSPPLAQAPPLRVMRVPLDEAIVLAVRLSRQFGSDIAVVDREGLWPDKPPHDQSYGR